MPVLVFSALSTTLSKTGATSSSSSTSAKCWLTDLCMVLDSEIRSCFDSEMRSFFDSETRSCLDSEAHTECEQYFSLI